MFSFRYCCCYLFAAFAVVSVVTDIAIAVKELLWFCCW
jgi:hypothetical protein